LLLDSLSTQPFENFLGRRPMRVAAELEGPSTRAVNEMAARLRPPGFRYREMLDGVLHTLTERAPEIGGGFAYDYGDAPGYAASVLLAAGDAVRAARIVQHETQLLAWPRPRDFDEVSFGVGALFAARQQPGATDTAVADSAIRRYLLFSGSLAIIDRYYLDWLDWFTGGGGGGGGATGVGWRRGGRRLVFFRRRHRRRGGGGVR